MLRFDRTGKVDSFERTKEGFLRIRGTIAHTGWLRYVRADGTEFKELVDEEELFKEAHLNSIGLQPLTFFHPDGKVTPKNFKQHNVGMTGSHVFANQKKGHVEIITMIGDEEAIAGVESGLTTDMSEGYECKPVRYKSDWKQTDRICNHNALVDQGRAPNAKLHLDSNCVICEPITDTIDIPKVNFYLSGVNLNKHNPRLNSIILR